LSLTDDNILRKMRIVSIESALASGTSDQKVLDKNHYNLPKCDVDESCEAYQSMREFIMRTLRELK